MKRHWFACVCVYLSIGCGSSIPAYQTISIPEVDDTQITVGISQQQVLEMLDRAGASNVVVAMGMSPGGESVISAVTADLVDKVYLFRDGTYESTVIIPHDPGYPPYHPTLKILTLGDSSALVLLADGLAFEGKRSGLMALFGDDGITAQASLPLSGLAARHGGMKDPYIGGTDLVSGILLSARDDQGKPWKTVYVLGIQDKALSVSSLTSSEACSCSNYFDWKSGQDGRTLFGKVVE